MAKSILNTIHRKITELSKKHPHLFLDFLADHIGDASFQWFLQLLPERKSTNITFAELVLRLYMIVIHRKKGWENILQKILKFNASYIEGGGYNNLSPEKLKELFEEDAVPSLAESGVAPEMMIMYLIYKRKFNDPLMPFLLDEYAKAEQKIESASVYTKDHIKISETIKGTVLEQELNAFISEEIVNVPDEDEYKRMAEENGFEYLPDKKQFVVPRGLVLFLHEKLKDIHDDKVLLDRMYRVLLKSLKDVNDHAKRLVRYHDKFKEAVEENSRLKREVKLLRKKITAYEKKHEQMENRLKQEAEKDKDSIILDLQKQLNYAYSRIEKLEERISELEEAKEINREIKENVRVEEVREKEGLQIDEGSFIVISGGRWNSRTKEDVEELLADYGCVVEFIPAEDTIKKQDLIANADLVVFDTSRHAHKYFYKIKQINGNIVFINRSRVEEIKKLI